MPKKKSSLKEMNDEELVSCERKLRKELDELKMKLSEVIAENKSRK